MTFTSLGLSNGIAARRASGRGPTHDLNFVQAAISGGTLDSRIAFSRGTPATMFDSQGRMGWAPHNLVRNTAFAGLVPVGTAAPNSASWTFATGMTWSGTSPATQINRAVVGTGQIGGRTYVDFRIWGTNDGGSTAFPHIFFVGAAATAGLLAPGTQFGYAHEIQIIGGSTAGLNRPARPVAQWINSGGTYLGQASNSNIDAGTPNTTMRRLWVWGAVPAGADRTNSGIEFAILPGATCDLTVRVHSPTAQFWGATSPLPFAENTSTSAALFLPRLEYDPVTLAPRGLLIEPTRVNRVLNSMMVGASTPSTLPNNWLFLAGGAPGASVSVQGTGVEDGMNYVDLRFQTTGASAGNPTRLAFEGTSSNAPVVASSAYTMSFYVRRVAGSNANITTLAARMTFRDNLAAITTTAVGSSILATLGATSIRTNRAVLTGTADASATGCNPELLLDASGAVDITLRIAAPQNEASLANSAAQFATSFIPTWNAAVTRNGDTVQPLMGLAQSFPSAGYTMAYEYEIGGLFGPGFPVSLATGDGDVVPTREETTVWANGSQIGVETNGGGTAWGAISMTDPGGIRRLAISCALNNTRASINGAAVASDLTVAVPQGVNQVSFGSRLAAGASSQMPQQLWVRRFRVWPRNDFTDPQLQALAA